MEALQIQYKYLVFWYKSHHHFFVKEMWVATFPVNILTFCKHSRLQSSKFKWGVTINWISSERASIGSVTFWCKLHHHSAICSRAEIRVTKKHHISIFHKYRQIRSSVAPKPMGMSTPQMHITWSSYLSTFSQSKSGVHSRLRFGDTAAQSPLIWGTLVALHIRLLVRQIYVLTYKCETWQGYRTWSFEKWSQSLKVAR